MSRRNAFCTLLSLVVSGLAAAQPSAAQRHPPAEGPGVVFDASSIPAPMRLAEAMSLQALISMSSAELGARDQLEALTAWNISGNLPTRVGFARPLPGGSRVVLSETLRGHESPAPHAGGFVARSAQGDLVWGTSVYVEGAYRLRLHLSDLELPSGTRMWVNGMGEEHRAFGLELLAADGTLWTPSVGGEWIFFEIQRGVGASWRMPT